MTTDPGERDGRTTPDEPPLQQHGDPLLAAAEGHPQGEGSRHGHDADPSGDESSPDDSGGSGG
jgi:hypothetical protein